ncbi:MAG: CNNM domain-containing protein, partial [Treponema sp.]|nr:CNNM domain-containing protein [Treponema sp.]
MEDPWSSAAFFPALCAALVAAGGFFSLFSHALRSSKKAVLSKESEAAGARRAARLRRTIAAFERPARSLAAAGFWGGALRAFAAALAGIGAARLAPEGSAFAAWILVALSALAIATAILAADHAARRAARHAPEQVAAALLPAISAFALPLAPLFFLARKVAALTRRVFPSRAEDEGITEDELRAALIEGEKSGIVESGEREMVEGVFYLGDRPLGAFMTHRSELRWLEADSGLACALEKALEQNAQACFPVADGSLDAIVGAAYREDIVLAAARDPGASLRSVMRKASFAPETMPALKAFKIFRPGETEALFVM